MIIGALLFAIGATVGFFFAVIGALGLLSDKGYKKFDDIPHKDNVIIVDKDTILATKHRYESKDNE